MRYTCTMLPFVWLGYVFVFGSNLCEFYKVLVFYLYVQNTTGNFRIFPFKFDFCSSHFKLESTHLFR